MMPLEGKHYSAFFPYSCSSHCGVEDAIEILEYILKMREEKLGTANPEVDDEKKRLAELLKEAGRRRNRKGKSLEKLLDARSTKKESAKRWSTFGFRT
ncbi:hypothetical protein GOBAR_AA37740 [Gossypium barbadense]|uniref:Uncharacterized protein n=1 Tax=Gossypium barbadense TaxID=3634 RepID=A0A2P5VVU9_GOSBA|nr:hypothetical protein GOBAR_AA37740 [Gossypium barbadense]